MAMPLDHLEQRHPAATPRAPQPRRPEAPVTPPPTPPESLDPPSLFPLLAADPLFARGGRPLAHGDSRTAFVPTKVRVHNHKGPTGLHRCPTSFPTRTRPIPMGQGNDPVPSIPLSFRPMTARAGPSKSGRQRRRVSAFESRSVATARRAESTKEKLWNPGVGDETGRATCRSSTGTRIRRRQ